MGDLPETNNNPSTPLPVTLTLNPGHPGFPAALTNLVHVTARPILDHTALTLEVHTPHIAPDPPSLPSPLPPIRRSLHPPDAYAVGPSSAGPGTETGPRGQSLPSPHKPTPAFTEAGAGKGGAVEAGVTWPNPVASQLAPCPREAGLRPPCTFSHCPPPSSTVLHAWPPSQACSCRGRGGLYASESPSCLMVSSGSPRDVSIPCLGWVTLG